MMRIPVLLLVALSARACVGHTDRGDVGRGTGDVSDQANEEHSSTADHVAISSDEDGTLGQDHVRTVDMDLGPGDVLGTGATDDSADAGVGSSDAPADMMPPDGNGSDEVDAGPKVPDAAVCSQPSIPPQACQPDTHPPCPYDEVSFFIAEPFTITFQFEVYSPGASSPGLPDGVICDSGAQLVLFRMKWYDCWAIDGCVLEGPCGGHCFPSAGYVYVIDPQSHQIVAHARESLSSWKQWEPKPALTLAEGVVDGTFVVDLPEHSARYVYTHGGLGPPYGTSAWLPEKLQVLRSPDWKLLKSLDLPLF